MNEVTLIGKIEKVSIKDFGSWVNCGILIKNDRGLDTWFDVKGVNKTGKEMEWLPQMEGRHVLVGARMTSYINKKTNEVVYGVSASKSGLKGISEESARLLLDQNWGGTVKMSGKIEGSKATEEGHFLKVGIGYLIPNAKEGKPNFGTYYVRVRCPEGFDAARHEEGSYVSVFGQFDKGPDNKPMVKALCVG